MVVMDFAAAALTGIWHERRGAPPISTVQAPHAPSPQPYLAPVRPSSSRSTISRLRSGCGSTSCDRPLTIKLPSLFRAAELLRVHPDRAGRDILGSLGGIVRGSGGRLME